MRSGALTFVAISTGDGWDLRFRSGLETARLISRWALHGIFMLGLFVLGWIEDRCFHSSSKVELSGSFDSMSSGRLERLLRQ